MARVDIRALEEDDLRAYPVVKGKYSKLSTNKTLDSVDVFGSSSANDYELKFANERRRGRIVLCRPVINQVLARKNGSLLFKVLGVDSKLGRQIANFTVGYQDGEYREMHEIDYYEDFLLEGQIAQHLIDNFDYDAELEKTFYLTIAESICKSDVSITTLEECLEITKGSGDALLAGDYYLSYNDEGKFFAKCAKKGLTPESNITSAFAHKAFSNASSRLSYLLALKNGENAKRILSGMLYTNVVVLPIIYRGKVNGREEALEKAYGALIAANNALKSDIESNAGMTAIRDSYRKLASAVSDITFETTPGKYNVSTAQLEKLTTKKGDVRAKTLGKRQDWSGRAVVIIDPFQPVDTVSIPLSQIYKLLEFHLLPKLSPKEVMTFVKHSNDCAYFEKLLKNTTILNNIELVLGRQPTLHKQSLQGFKIRLTNSEAIVMNPLVCPGFNMDFDGDTAHIEVPITAGAVDEVKYLINTTANLYYAKTGECCIEPRQDILYGLFMCTRDIYTLGTPIQSATTYKAIFDLVTTNKIKVSDTVTVAGETLLAGHAAIKYCFSRPIDLIETKGSVQIHAKNISKYVELALDQGGVHEFVDTTNKLVELGFKIGRLYPPSVSLLLGNDAYDFSVEKEGLQNTMSKFNRYVAMGLMTNEMYADAYSREEASLQKKIDGEIYDKLGVNNGYRLMAESGARGNKSNLRQMFAYKGFVKKDATTSFDTAITSSVSDQLTPFEGFMAAHGGRTDQMAKSLKTGDTGYFSRQLWQACGHLVITNDDCGTTQGIRISIEDIAKASSDEIWQYDFMVHSLAGRYNATTGELITEEAAKEFAANAIRAYQSRTAEEYTDSDYSTSIVVRSPLTCANPCCVKCYGIDPGTHKLAVKGLAVGFIAAQSVGEPGTQLTMKQFQKGGVAGAGDVTSDFDRIAKYTGMSGLRKAARSGNCPTYDPLAPRTGPVTIIPCTNQREAEVCIDGKKSKIIVPKNAELKSYVKKGENISKKVGDLCPHEILEYNGVDALQRYLVQKMSNIYVKSCGMINPKHFEVIVASMTQAMIISTDEPDWRVGQYVDTFTLRQRYAGEKEVAIDENKTIYKLGNTTYFKTLLSVKTVPIVASNALNSLVFEDMGRSLSRAYLLGLSDDISRPLVRMLLGKAPKLGTYYPNYITERRL